MVLSMSVIKYFDEKNTEFGREYMLTLKSISIYTWFKLTIKINFNNDFLKIQERSLSKGDKTHWSGTENTENKICLSV